MTAANTMKTCRVLKSCMDHQPGSIVELAEHHARELEAKGYVQILDARTKVVRATRNKAAG